jgi:hypothetical protein
MKRPLLRLSFDTTHYSTSSVKVSCPRAPWVECLVPHFGVPREPTSVTIFGDQLGLTQDDVHSVTINGQRCEAVCWMPATVDGPASLACVIPPLRTTEGCPPSGLAFDVIVTTISGLVSGTCSMKFLYIEKTELPPPAALNPERKRPRNQMVRRQCRVLFQTIMDHECVIWHCLAPDDRPTRMLNALRTILMLQVQRAVTESARTQQRTPALLVRVFYVDNIAASKKGYFCLLFHCRKLALVLIAR